MIQDGLYGKTALTERESPVDKRVDTPGSKTSIFNSSQNFHTTQATARKYYTDQYQIDSALKNIARSSVVSTGVESIKKRDRYD